MERERIAQDRGAPRRREDDVRRAIVLVDDSLGANSRGTRIARSLAAAGWDTTVVGIAAEGMPAGELLPPAYRPIAEDAAALAITAPARDVRLLRLGASAHPAFLHGRDIKRGLLYRVPIIGGVVGALGGPLGAGAWGDSLRDLPPADLYHACGSRAAVVACDLAREAKRRGRAGRMVYDYIDVAEGSDLWFRAARWRRFAFSRIEQRAVGAADGMTSANDASAAYAKARWKLPRTPLAVYDAPPRTEIPPPDTPDLLRTAIGIPRERAVILYIGSFGLEVPLLEAGDAVLQMRDAAFVALGSGTREAELRARDREPRRKGRHFTLPPVPHEAVTRWTAGADATLVLTLGDDGNDRYKTPERLWESLAAGVPAVVGEQQVAAQQIVEPDDLGVRARANDVASLTAALRTLVDAPDAGRAARRDRARRLAAERYAWDITIPRYLRLVRELVVRPATAR